MKIVHTADLQVKNRSNNLYRVSNDMLKQIEQVLIDTKAEGYVVAGDLFEYPEPTDSERKLIYNHISRVLNISTVKEIILFAGNHDLIKEKKQTETSLGYNPINIFADMLENIDKEKSKKILYISESKVYDSRLSSKIQYLGYSLEDDIQTNFENADPDAFKFCIFHAMLREYVDSRKIPLRKDIKDSLLSIDSFPGNSIILAGDIHERLEYRGLDNQRFYYPGSPMQHTHSEGTYITINEDKNKIKHAEKKAVKCYEFDETLKNITIDDIIVTDIELKNSVYYVTITLNTKLTAVQINEKLNDFDFVNFDGIKTFIKVKSTNKFVRHERQFYDLIYSKFEQSIKPKISFEYDKIDFESKSNNKVIQSIIDSKEKALQEITKSELTIEPDNIDDLLLSDIQLQSLFKSVADEQFNKISFEDFENADLSKDITAIFNKQLQAALDTSSKRYNIILEFIETNGFMPLKNNRIDLNIPGLTRILGTNGIGKTTLYRMIRWCITGEVFEGMQKNTVMKNNLLVFNKKNYWEDTVVVKLQSTINNLPVTLTRTVTRKWKNNTTDEQKASIDWKEYISSVDRHFKINLIQPSGEEREIVGETAEKSVALWFGNTVNNILFMNHTKLENILSTPADKLNELILSFIGVDYLKKLENNLEDVKTELMTISKPKKSKDDLELSITDNKILIKNDKEKIDELNLELKLTEDKIKLFEKTLSDLNDKLISIGNIPLIIEDHNTEIDEIESFLENFEERKAKDKIPFVLSKPESCQEDIDKLNKSIDENNKIISDNLPKISDLINEKSQNIELFNVIHKEKIADTDSELLEVNQQITEKNKQVKVEFEKVQVYIDDLIKKFTDKLDEKIKDNNNFGFTNTDLTEKIEKNLETLKSGKCDKCGTILAKNFDEHKIKIETENIQYTTTIENNKKSIDSNKQIITKLDSFIKLFKDLRDLSIKQDIKVFDEDTISVDCKSNKDQIQSLNNEIQLLGGDLSKINESRNIWDKLLLIQYNNYSIQSYIITSNEEINLLIEKHKKYVFDIDELNKIYDKTKEIISTDKDRIAEINKKYNEELEEYNTNLTENIQENNEIDKHNKTVEEHNQQKLLKISEHYKLKNTLGLIEKEKLPLYEQTNKTYNEEKTKHDALNVLWKTTNQTIQGLELNLKHTENNLNLVRKEFDDYLEYQKNNILWKMYSKLIKNNFKDIVFEYYRAFLNKTLNTLLESVNFKLFWNEQSELYMVDYNSGICSYQPVQQSSGMETTFLGLALVYTMHLLNVKNTISHIFIDEISGTLNKGEELTYDANNYQELLVMILSKFKDKTVFIIDHNIKNLFETVTYEVRPSDNGSEIIQL